MANFCMAIPEGLPENRKIKAISTDMRSGAANIGPVDIVAKPFARSAPCFNKPAAGCA